MELPAADYLHQCLSYDPDTGILTWKSRPPCHFDNAIRQRQWNTKFAGKSAGGKCAGTPTQRYVYVAIGHVKYGAHRLAWVLMTGEWSAAELDHINGDRTDNSWANLREATRQQNGWNSRHTRTPWRGVVYNARSEKYMARLVIKRKELSKHLGTFDTPEEAHAAWCTVASETRGRFFRVK